MKQQEQQCSLSLPAAQTRLKTLTQLTEIDIKAIYLHIYFCFAIKAFTNDQQDILPVNTDSLITHDYCSDYGGIGENHALVT